MGTISLSYIYFNFLRESERETLAAFARDDGCYRVYKFAMQPGGPKDHALPVRSASDEQAMFGSQRVYDPVCIWPANERSEPLRSHLQRVTLTGDTLEQARQSIPAGYTIVFEQIASAGGQRTATREGKTAQEAEQKAEQLIPSGAPVVSRNLVENYRHFSIQVKAKSTDEARELAHAAAKEKGFESFTMKDHLAGSAADQRGPEKIKLTVNAPDEAGALVQGQAAAQAKGFEDPHFTVKLATPGKKGFLGIGSKPNQYDVWIVQPALYDVEVTQLASFEIVYTQKSQIDAVIGV